MKALIVIAHPDDEVIYFWQVIRTLVAGGREVHVLCATGEFGSSDYTAVRRREFHRACRLLKAKPIVLGLTDSPGPLDDVALRDRLTEWADAGPYEHVYTHGILGEYGHSHHMDVSWAVHRMFDPVTSLAGAVLAVETHALSHVELAAKREMATAVYRSQPHAALWCTDSERFTRLRPDEVVLLRFLSLHQLQEAVGFVRAQPSPARARLLGLLRSSGSLTAGPPGWHETLTRFQAAVGKSAPGAQTTDFS